MENIDYDWFLQNLVRAKKTGSTGTAITLLVDGFLVSGMLINGEEYFNGIQEDFAQYLTQEQKENLRYNLEPYKKFYVEAYKGKIEEDETLPIFIHLKDAKFYNTQGMPIPGNQGICWRGRLSQISGFNLGLLSANVE